MINSRCQVRSRDGRRLVVVGGTVIAQYAVGDRMSEALAMVNLVEQGYAEQVAVARAFGCAPRTIRRYQERFETGGLAALGRVAAFREVGLACAFRVGEACCSSRPRACRTA